MRRSSFAALAAVASFAVLAAPRDASACGGCFVPTENNTVVTDHRMILSVSPQQTTLYDQIRYQGDPASFAWVLPTAGPVEVGLSADVVFASLDAMTQVQVFPPPRNCAPGPVCDDFGGDRALASAPSGGAENGGVTVNKRETVGPYETVQLSATDPEGLDKWLGQNGFVVPADVKPVIAQYVREHFDFLAMKLVPNATVKSMRPVRVTTKGASPVLPLRMVAAGTGPVVGITLWVLGEGRYEPKNFPSFTIEAADLIWDWNANASNYKALRDARTLASGGKGWELETSTTQTQNQIRQTIQNGGRFFGGGGRGGPTVDPGQDYLPVPTAAGTIGKSASQVREEDIATLFSGIRASDLRVTRLRADLAHAALSEDLLLYAPPTQSVVANGRTVTREANQPLCPIFQGCKTVGQAPRDEAKAQSTPAGIGAGKTCAVGVVGGLDAGSFGTGAALIAAAGFLGIGFGARRRRSGR